ncbi:hypothetical protein F5878DRAFT_526350 [Lentinula raphanica]|uniref:Matrin-type domain-containing protein n=1 Tax=Lentinula raphanica TaxID=153919 RepID=A0AA38PJJ6_9AGAR|nr:hypothetical protein F5878DRAFT_526350 [Lentinula raphanica]
MSEYWVSKKKYFCKYCEIFITDDVPSRQHHENGLRHKGNRERYIRGLYKEGEKRKKDLDDEKREMARIELAAQAAYSQDIGAGRAKASSSSVSATTSKKSTLKAPSKPSNPFTNYSTAASLGFTDPDVERAAAEAALRQNQGVVGEWQVVETPTVSTPTPDEGDTSDQSLKRPADQEIDDVRNFKLQRKTVGVGLGEIYDPGEIKFDLKKKKRKATVKVEDEAVKVKTEAATVDVPEQKPKWSAVKWKRATSDAPPVPDDQGLSHDIANEAGAFVDQSESVVAVKVEDEGATSPNDPSIAKIEPAPPEEVVHKAEPEQTKSSTSPTATPAPSLFRKRKVAAGSGSRVKREL